MVEFMKEKVRLIGEVIDLWNSNLNMVEEF